jgi:hypothetical protein
MTALAGWQNFYVIVGSSAGALIGLQFVVLSLINSSTLQASPEGGNAFATPTVVHFGVVLGLAAVLCAPWESLAGPAAVWGLLGLIGIIYEIAVTRRMSKLTLYRPEFEDWLFHSVLPFVSYVALAGAAAAVIGPYGRPALFTAAGAVLLLLFIGIHNAWDAVTYHVFVRRGKAQQSPAQD